MAVYCKHCGARTDIRQANCPVCRADQRKRRAAFFAVPAVLLVCVLTLGALFGPGLRRAAQEKESLLRPSASAEADTAAAPDAETVYVTIAGTKFHRDGCSHLSDTKEAIARTEAQRLGYTPCADCFGEP